MYPKAAASFTLNYQTASRALGQLVRRPLLTCCDEPVYARCYHVLMLSLLEHVHAFVIYIRGMVDNVDAMSHAHLHRVACAGVGAQPLVEGMGCFYTSRCLLIGEKAVLS